MILPDDLYEHYINAHLKLLHYVGLKTKLLENNKTYQEFKNLDFNFKYKCRKELIKDISFINDYLREDFDKLSRLEIQIIEGFKSSISGSFIIYKCLKHHAIFFDVNKNLFYEVKALKDRFEEMLPDIPMLIETVLLPYEDFIIYDGFIVPTNVFIRGKHKKELNNLYKEAKLAKRIVKMIEK